MRSLACVFPLLLLLGCGGDDDDGPPEPPLPTTCDEARSQLMAFAGAHTACSSSNTCQSLDALGDLELCGLVLAPGSDGSRLAALQGRWNELDCNLGDDCGFQGAPVCGPDGRCAIEDPAAACLACPQDLEPVCTTGGLNARNACRARACLGQEPASSGFCPDSASCVAAGGTCNELAGAGYFCPEGARFSSADLEQGCAGGDFQSTCCIADWTQPCTYLGVVSSTLSVNPFTCQPDTLPICLMGQERDLHHRGPDHPLAGRR